MMNNAVRESTAILTIEDDDLIRESFRSFLEDHGFTVFEAADGLAGLALYQERRPHLILLDLRLPKLDGLDLLRRISAESPQTPVIIVSGMGTIDDVVEALRCGAWDYLTKPVFDMDLLLHAVDKALTQSRLQRENRRYQEHLEEEVARRTAELNQAQKLEALGTLAGGIAHDFNNVLSAILGYTELCLLQAEAESDLADNLEQIRIAADRASELIHQILSFSRKRPDRVQALTMAPVVKETLKLLRASLPATVRLHQQISVGNAQVEASPTEIHQLLMNLCTNAFHALHEEKGDIEIMLAPVDVPAGRFADLAPGSYLRLTVVDDGIGMDADTLARVYDPFFTTKDEGKGTGLGMSVVYGIVQAKKGKIEISSRPGQGTVVNIYLPAMEGSSVQTMPHTSDLPGGQGHILFIDDEEALARLGQRILTHLGYSVQPCTDSDKAFALFAASPASFDLVITDQTMPGMTGTDLIKAIRTIKPYQPILLCTGYSALIDNDVLQRLGINGFMKKPLTIKGLASEVDRILEEYRRGPLGDAS